MDKIELITDHIGHNWATKTSKGGNKQQYTLTQNEALILGAIIGLQIAIDALTKKVK